MLASEGVALDASIAHAPARVCSALTKHMSCMLRSIPPHLSQARHLDMTRTIVVSALLAASFAAGSGARSFSAPAPPATASSAAPTDRVFEMRTYTTYPGRLDALNARFRNHTMRIFANHGMTSIGYWIPEDSTLSSNTLVYIIAHQSRAQAAKNWSDFVADPEWKRVSTASEADGKIVSKIESVFLSPTDYSQIK
jgi:hypothetical protein